MKRFEDLAPTSLEDLDNVSTTSAASGCRRMLLFGDIKQDTSTRQPPPSRRRNKM
jgi:hypothetical protein